QFSDVAHPQYLTHRQILRATHFIPVVLGPKFHRSDRTDAERELWAQDVVVLFKPWRVPADLKSQDQSWLEVASVLIGGLLPWHRRVIQNMNVLTECRDAR
ncbi:hypothetical protein C8F04DRAFT_901505, partial [Mycena alexandri]